MPALPMSRYALLVRESSNRVFGASAPELLAAEVTAIGPHLDGGALDLSLVELGGLSYLAFNSSELTDRDVFIVSNLSLGRGLFEWDEADRLRPLQITPLVWFESDLITIQRYAGKTNEQFTHLLVNLGLASSQSAHERAASGQRVRLFDPVAGRGSTLNRALMYGFDVGGVELDETHFDQYRVFLSTYLRDHRIKHDLSSERIRKGDLAGCAAFDIEIGPKSDSARQHVRMARGSTDLSAGLFPGQKFDVVVGDLPYGLAHSAKAKATSERSPERLVRESLPSWRKLMESGASLALSWNLKSLSREALGNALVDGGLVVEDYERSFEHEVDRQITRDVMIAHE